MQDASTDTAEMVGYDEDFYAWTQHTAALLRAGRTQDVDLEHVAEEIEDMGRRDGRELNSRVQVLLAHLLKCLVQPDQRSPSWFGTITSQRLEIEALLEQSPSLRLRLAGALASNYARAVRRAAAETGLGRDRFPSVCPFTREQLLDADFLP